jgi:hypothetical protein
MHSSFNLSDLQHFPDMDNQMRLIELSFNKGESDIPILMQFLVSPRGDGQQRVIYIHLFEIEEEVEHLAQKILDAIKKV